MTEWRKSSRSTTSENTNCVEVAALACNIGVRDSKNPDGPKLALPSTGFQSLVTAIKRGDHDLP
ncbi:DUF397 domain-containing protein [Actinomadura macrotermitis]|uniref:DUF397 domain-containing protein n=1 Tax=Actinomadura macrotermitis TaxID=2585200 RepID=A0A7K0C1L7_9ACTN|nr:DUF397 domain-containing protein [Actinomadura macrotermitis]MQY07337.1 hypothetical protein [Actinomadura macrotermitis]